MGVLITAMGTDLTGLKHVPRRSYEPSTNAAILVAAAGGNRAAARILGVAESTVRRWLQGAKPRDPHRLVEAARLTASMRYKPGAYDAAYQGDTLMVITAWIRISGDKRKRSVSVGQHIPQRRMQAVLRAWRAGDDDKAERLLIKAIDEEYTPMAFENVLSVRFE